MDRQVRFGPTDSMGHLSPEAGVETTEGIAREVSQLAGACLACVPAVRPGIFTQIVDIPEGCLPLPADAFAICPALTLSCSTGTPIILGPGRVSVPNSLTTAPYVQVISAPGDTFGCSFPVPELTTAETPLTVSCPSTVGISCTCHVTLGPCTCGFNPERTQVICNYAPSTLTVDCVACPPVRGLGTISTPL